MLQETFFLSLELFLKDKQFLHTSIHEGKQVPSIVVRKACSITSNSTLANGEVREVTQEITPYGRSGSPDFLPFPMSERARTAIFTLKHKYPLLNKT